VFLAPAITGLERRHPTHDTHDAFGMKSNGDECDVILEELRLRRWRSVWRNCW
jgi:hypothetical protein